MSWNIALPVLHKWEVFEKIYLTKIQLEKRLNLSLPTINKMIESEEILEFNIRNRKVYIIKNEFIKYLIS